MHGNLEPEESVWPDWDIEDIKKAFIDNAKDYDKIMNEYVGTALFLGIGIVVTYYQAKWYEYDPDKDF